MSVSQEISIKRVGLVANPVAGAGRTAIEQAIRHLLTTVYPVVVVAGEGTLETVTAKQMGVSVETVEAPSGLGPKYLTELARRVLSRDVDIMVGVGGDGTLNAIANALATLAKQAPPLLGVGAGSCNVGPLVSILARDINKLRWDSLIVAHVHGLQFAVNGQAIGIAFNDVVFSNLFLGTEGGALRNFDARAILTGTRCYVQPRSVCGRTTCVFKNGRLMLSGKDAKIAQIVACPVNEPQRFVGTAATGFLSWGPYVGCPGVLAAASTVLIQAGITIKELLAAEPLHLWHIAFGFHDHIGVSGLVDGAVLVADGNPVAELSTNDYITLTLIANALQVLKQTTC